MSTLIGFTILVMLGLFTYVLREFYYKRKIYMVLVLWLELFAITIAVSAFLQNVNTSNIAELIYVFCGILAPIAVFIKQNYEKINNFLDLSTRIPLAIDGITKIIKSRPKKPEHTMYVEKVFEENSIDPELLPIDSVSVSEPLGYVKLGDEYMDAGFYEEALDCYKRFVEIKKDGFEGYLKIGICYESLGSMDEAISAYRKSILINPKYIEGYISLGTCYTILSKYETAIDLYMEAIKKNTDEYELYFHLGITYEHCKKYPEAVKAYEMALEYNPADEEIVYHLGAVLTELRKYDEAIIAYKSALEVKPSDSELFYNLSILYSLLHKPDIAIDNLKKAVELNKDIKYTVLRNKAFDSIRSYSEFKKVIS